MFRNYNYNDNLNSLIYLMHRDDTRCIVLTHTHEKSEREIYIHKTDKIEKEIMIIDIKFYCL